MSKRKELSYRAICFILVVGLILGNVASVYADPAEETAEMIIETMDMGMSIQDDSEDAFEILEPEEEAIPEIIFDEQEEAADPEILFDEPEEESDHTPALAAEAEEEREMAPEELGYVPGEILVVYEDNATDRKVEKAAEALDGEVTDVIENSEQTVAVVNISEETTVEAAIEEYEADPSIAYAEPNYVLVGMDENEDDETGDDTGFDYLAAIHATGEDGAFAILNAWKEAGNRINPVTVGIIDAGFDCTNEAISGRISADSIKLEQWNNTITENVLPETDETGNRHGTNVAEILAETAGDSVDSIVLVDSGVKADGMHTVSSVAYAISYLSTKADIINMSLGTVTDAQSAILSEAILSAYQNGITMVCSAGNGTGTSTVWPSDHPNTISVMAVNESGKLWEESGSGSLKDIAAPGVNIPCGTNHELQSGTSLSAPMVSAAAAVLRSVSSNLLPYQILNILLKTADNTTGVPVLNMGGAVSEVTGIETGTSLSLSEAEVLLGILENGYHPNWKNYIKLAYNGHTLTENVDYKVTDKGETVNEDTITITLSLMGIGSFSGIRDLSFDIPKADIADITYTITGSRTYLGEGSVMPEVTIRHRFEGQSKKTLKEGQDYTLSYGANDTVGEGNGVIHVTGASYFGGTTDIVFDILGPEDVVAEGDFGENIRYSLYADGTLMFTGSGEMVEDPKLDWEYEHDSYFKDFKDANGNSLKVNKVVVGEGITSICASFLAGCSAVTEIVLPESLEKIGKYAFAGTGITEIEIPDGVVSENNTWNAVFTQCKNLKEVKLPASLPRIGEYMFDGCISLKMIEIPKTVTTIDGEAFGRCTELESIDIPESVTSIGSGAFGGCTKLESIDIPESVTDIGSGVFYGCTSLKTVTLPEKITVLPGGLFYGCTDLESVIIPGNCECIGDGAFWGCNIQEVELPKTLKTIGSHAFDGCKIQEIDLPDSLEVIEEYAFNGCNISSIIFPDSLKQIGSNALHSRQTVDIYIHSLETWLSLSLGCSISYYGYHLYIDGEELTSLIIPEGVTELHDYAFCGCCYLESVTIPESLTKCGECAFAYCSRIKTVNAPDLEHWLKIDFEGGRANPLSGKYYNAINWGETELSVDWGDEDFLITGSEVNYSGNDGVDLICDGEVITSLIIPDGMTEIRPFAMTGCKSITKLVLPGSVESIGTAAFAGCVNLTETDLEEGLQTIGQGAFSYCINLKSVIIPSSILTIGKGAFGGCKNLETIILPATSNITAEDFPDFFEEETDIYITSENDITGTCGTIQWSLTEGGALIITGSGTVNPFIDEVNVWDEYADRIKALIIGEGITSIRDHSFEGFDLIETVSFPNTLQEIGDHAFAYCTGIEELRFSAHLTDFGIAAFYGCTGLKKMSFLGHSSREIGDNAFAWCTNLELIDELYAESIGAGAFNHCTALKYIDADVCSVIGDFAFFGCTSLEEVNVSGNYIGKAAFGYCTNMIGAYINVEMLGDMAFIGCTSLGKSNVSNAVDINSSRIGNYAFYSCSELRYLIGEFKGSIGDYAFYGCTSLYSLRDCGTNDLEQIGRFAFAGNTDLMEGFTFSNPNTQIGDYAFYNDTILRDVNLPANQIYLKDGTFAFCDDLWAVIDGHSMVESLSEGRTLGKNVFVKSWDVSDLSEVEADIVRYATIAEGADYTLEDTADADAEILTSTDVILSVNDYESGNHTVHGNAPGEATVICRQSDGTIAKWIIEVKPPIEMDLEGLYEPTEFQRFNNCKHTTFIRVVTKNATLWEDGKTELKCKSCGQIKKNTDITIYRVGSITPSKLSFAYNGGVQKPTVTVKNSQGSTITSNYYTVTYSNSSSWNIGTYRVIVTLKGIYSGTKEFTYNIYCTHPSYERVVTKAATTTQDGKTELKCKTCGKIKENSAITIYKASNITLSKTSYTYNGSVQKPTVTVKNSQGNKISTSYYTVKYSNSSSKMPGSYKVTVSFKGRYGGAAKVLTYKINCPHTSYHRVVTQKATTTKDGKTELKCKICGKIKSNSVIPIYKASKVSLSQTSFVFNGKEQRPEVIVKNSQGKKINSNYYTITTPTYSKKGGTYKVTVSFKGRYTGDPKVLTYVIEKADNPMTVTVPDAGVNVKYGKNQTIKKDNIFTIVKSKGSVSFKMVRGDSRITIDSSSGNITVQKGLKKGTYTLRVKVTDAGTLSFKPKSITVTLRIHVV